MLIDGEDFTALTDHRLTFTPSHNNMSQEISLNITSDGCFENKEIFNATLTTGFVRLGLKFKTVSLKDTLCREDLSSPLMSLSQVSSVRDIPLDRVSLIENEDNNIEIRLANVESNRVLVGPRSTQVIILDNDSE